MKALLAGLLLFVGLLAHAEPVTLRFAVYHGGARLALHREMIAQFERENPDIRIEIEVIPSYPMYIQKLMAQYAANVAPDIGYFDGSYLPFARRGALLPLNDFIAQDPEVDLADYYPNLVRGYRYAGKDYLLPCEVLLFSLIFYNKAKFDEAGIPYPDGTWTWDYQIRPELREKDFLWVMQQLTRAAPDKRNKTYGYISIWGANFMSGLLTSRRIYETDDLEAPTRIILNNPEAIRTFDWGSYVMNRTGWMPSVTEFRTGLSSSSHQMFTQQRAAMFHGVASDIQRFRTEIGTGPDRAFDWDVTLFPRYAHAKELVTQGGASGLGIFRTTRYPEHAWRFVKFICGERGLRILGRAGATQPTMPRITNEPGIWRIGPQTPPELRVPSNIMATDLGTRALDIFNPPEYYLEARTTLETQVQNIAQGRVSAAEGIRIGVENAQLRLDESLKRRTGPPFAPWAGLLAGTAVLAALVGWVYAPERGRPLTRRARAENSAAYRFIGLWLFGTLALTFGPMVLSLLMSFTDTDIIQPPRFLGMGNYEDAFTRDPIFTKSLEVTTIYTLIGVPLGLVASLLLALLLNQRVRGIPFFRAMYYLPSLASGVAAAFIWRRIFHPDDGLLNEFIYGPGQWLGLPQALAPLVDPPGPRMNWLGDEQTALLSLNLMGLWGVGGGTIILLAGLQAIPEMYYEAATVDGAGPARKFWNVTLPLLTPALFFSLVTGVIGSFQVFTQAYVMTAGGPNNATMFYMLNLYRNAFESLQMGYASALAWILFVIILILTVLQFRLGRWVHYEH